MKKTLPARLLATALVVCGLLSCSEAPGPTSAIPSFGAEGAGATPALLGVTFLSCTPMDADSVTQDVGTDGGTINVGPHTLIIPAGALDSTVSITAIAPSDTINRVIFYPSGLQFNSKATLLMSYANCDPISALVPKRVAYVSADLSSVLDILPSLDLTLSQKTRGKLDHFSDYVVAW